MDRAAAERDAARRGLRLRGALSPQTLDGLPGDTQTVLLLGPDEPRFWPIFSSSEEFADGAPDPLDRWSKRVLGELATAWGGSAIFPSDGPPYPPFLHWARDSGESWDSPVGLMVHKDAGLFISYRGAIALPEQIALPQPAQPPCPSCAAPCLTSCPVDALNASKSYDVDACKTHMRSAAGAACREGCLVRLACPAKAPEFERLPVQSAFHNAAFLGEEFP
ncbi:MAG: ferredoxin [Pelagimonas sp.]|jgi:hypothetical protein|nr:ferredoxin [Pelagimonas sp.]